MAGAAGGIKNVPATVAAHPLVFATLTAPSFGPVHTAKKPGRPGSRRCTPRTGDRRRLCPHGRPLWCMAIHDHTDPATGQPLCVDCYDYPAIWSGSGGRRSCGDGSPSPSAATSPDTCGSPEPAGGPCSSWPADAAIAALTGGEEPYRGWGRWVDMLGFRGHLATKSRRYSVTLGRLRPARRD